MKATDHLLSRKEQDHARSNLHGEKRKQFIIRRATLRMTLGQMLNIEPDKMNIKTTRLGKPYLPQSYSLHFSISSSTEYFAIATHTSGPIGIDIEAKRMITMRDDLAKRILTADEWSAYSEVDTDMRDSYFLRLWTKKESIGKALGTGIARIEKIRIKDYECTDLSTIEGAAPKCLIGSLCFLSRTPIDNPNEALNASF